MGRELLSNIGQFYAIIIVSFERRENEETARIELISPTNQSYRIRLPVQFNLRPNLAFPSTNIVPRFRR